MPRLRPLTEAECYARLYGAGDSTVTVVHMERRPPRPRDPLIGEELRRMFEDRLDSRDPESFGEEAA
jgi:hypothetical protein